ncbi:MAG TPA: phosphoenolpyruvate--protein phosphotransferase [Vicinamibacterales bacterium]|jgi:phosphotransferase system enzyme I (PtsI)|nr:phosphoenolpyruvate--protein phosphotransferase [Vicinamibacterales bacterium]
MVLNGLGVSPGVGIGRALVVTRGARDLRFRIPERRVDAELASLHQARARAREQLQRIKARIEQASGAGHAYMFDAQILMLDDPMLVDRAAAIIRDEHLNAPSALRRALDEISAVFDDVEDSYLRERKGDVEDVVGRLEMNLRNTGDPADLFKDLEGPLVLVADELSPSIVAQLDWQRLAAFVTDAGSWTYHTAILARSLHVPAVAGLRHASAVVAPGALIAVDGVSGDVLVDPGPEALAELEARSKKRRAYERSLAEYRDLPSITLDGTHMRIEANVEIPEEAARAKERGAEGIGLYRSEFLLAGTSAASLDEEAQYAVYRRLIEGMSGGRVTVRTFDVTESQLGLPGHPEGSRSPLGLRGLRLSLSFDALFQAQLRALLRAASHGPLRIMFPFVTGIEELRAAKTVVAHAAEELRATGISVPDVPIGIMIEVPSAALTIDLLAEEADFFSIGTNDLIQYCLAVDRTDDRVSRMYEPLHPAILRVLRHVARGARRRGVPVSVCGEMAADPVLLPLLAGLGLREFSMNPAAIPLAKQVVRGMRISETARLASRALKAATAADVERTLAEFLSPART